jgi:hypothetical protein
LIIASDFIIKNRNIELLSDFIDVASYTTGSVDEVQSFVYARFLYALTKETIEITKKKKSKKLNDYLINSGEIYLENNITGEDKIENVKNLLKKL